MEFKAPTVPSSLWVCPPIRAQKSPRTAHFPLFTKSPSVHTPITPLSTNKKGTVRCSRVTPPLPNPSQTSQTHAHITRPSADHQPWMDEKAWVDNRGEGDTKEGPQRAAAHGHTVLRAITPRHTHTCTHKHTHTHKQIHNKKEWVKKKERKKKQHPEWSPA